MDLEPLFSTLGHLVRVYDDCLTLSCTSFRKKKFGGVFFS